MGPRVNESDITKGWLRVLQCPRVVTNFLSASDPSQPRPRKAAPGAPLMVLVDSIERPAYSCPSRGEFSREADSLDIAVLHAGNTGDVGLTSSGYAGHGIQRDGHAGQSRSSRSTSADTGRSVS